MDKGAKVTVYDAVAWENIKDIFGDKITFAACADDVLANSDCLVILTEWKEFLKYNPQDFKMLKDKVVFDGRNCFEPEHMQAAGVKYFCVGQNSVNNEFLLRGLHDQKKDFIRSSW